MVTVPFTMTNGLSRQGFQAPPERAKRYRQLARIHAANAKGEEQTVFMVYAGKWEPR